MTIADAVGPYLSKRARLAGLLLAVAACASHRVRLVVVTSSVAETVSLLGDTLYGLPLDAEGGPARVRELTAAREQLARDSSDLRAQLRLARATAAMGRMREAVGLLSASAQAHFDNPRVYRERGELLLRLRQLDLAIGDFYKAGLLSLGKLLLEPVQQSGDSASGAAPKLSFTALEYQVDFLLGYTLYCKGDYAEAYKVLAETVKAARSVEELSRALLWLFFAARRLGDGSEATNVLALVQPGWATDTHAAELEMLLAYRGVIASDSIQTRARAAKGEERALLSYGIAFFLQLQASRRDDAELWLERARSGGDWSSLSYLAAEADLARLRGVSSKRPLIIRPPS